MVEWTSTSRQEYTLRPLHAQRRNDDKSERLPERAQLNPAATYGRWRIDQAELTDYSGGDCSTRVRT